MRLPAYSEDIKLILVCELTLNIPEGLKSSKNPYFANKKKLMSCKVYFQDLFS